MSIMWGKAVKINPFPVELVGGALVMSTKSSTANAVPSGAHRIEKDAGDTRSLPQISASGFSDSPVPTANSAAVTAIGPPAAAAAAGVATRKYQPGVDPAVRIVVPDDPRLARRIDVLASYIAADGDLLEKVPVPILTTCCVNIYYCTTTWLTIS